MIEGSQPDRLSAAREDALQATQARNTLLTRTSNELRASLNAILGFTQLLEASELSHDDRDAAAQIAAAGHRVLGLIDELIDTALPEGGELRLSVEPVAAHRLSQDIAHRIEPLAAARDIIETEF